MSRTWVIIAGGLASCLTAGILAVRLPLADAAGGAGATQPSRLGVTPVQDRKPSGLLFRLSEGSPEPESRETAAHVPAEPLDEQAADALLGRLPPLVPVPAEERSFALREKSLPAPRAGKTIAETFPPRPAPGEAPAATKAPLAVLRRSPDGDVPLAPHVSVTFSQPMVAVTSHAELAGTPVPVVLAPQPAGAWRWVGTQTLVFETGTRLPMATDYQAEIPAGTRSALGNALAAPERWSFSTPAPTLRRSHPADGPARRDPMLFAAFDQRIDPAAVLRTIRVETPVGPMTVRLATPEEVKGDEQVARLAQDAQEGRWLAFRPTSLLPADALVTVVIGPGTPSAEGPKTTVKPQQWRFRTYGRMRVTGHQCGWRDECPPGTPWHITFSNPLDEASFSDGMVRCVPPLPGMRIDVSGNTLVVQGLSKGRTTYRVTLAAAIGDRFGQTLERDETVSFDVGASPPWLASQARALVVLDPAGGPHFSVYSVNHASLDVRARTVAPDDWPAYQQAIRERWRDDAVPLPGKPVLARTVAVRGQPDEVTETVIDLSPALRDGLGQVILEVTPTRTAASGRRQRIVAWVQATKMGLDAFSDAGELVGWATSLVDGTPLPGVQVTLAAGRAVAVTGADGVARLPLGADPAPVLVARRGNDIAILPEHADWYGDGGGWKRTDLRDSLRWYVFDDRHLYRPGEEVKVKGWLRVLGAGARGDVSPAPKAVRNVRWTLRDSRGNEVSSAAAPLNALGGFDLTLKLPPAMNLGGASLELAAPEFDSAAFFHSFQVQEFRRPEYEVKTTATEGPHVVGGHATVTASATYYAGGGLVDAETRWRVTSSPGIFVPPNRGDYTFGTWIPWWEPGRPRRDERSEVLEARTDGSGKHVLRVDFDSVAPPRPSNVRAEATIVDVNRQAWSAASDFLVHPATVYVGLKCERYFVQRGEPIDVQLIVTDLDGRAVAGRPVQLRAERLDWKRVGEGWEEQPAGAEDCDVTSATEPSRCTFRTPEGGTYRISATVTDDRGRPNESQIRRWVAGGKVPPRREVEQERVTMVPGKQEYHAGETAEILLIPPFTPAEGLVTLRRSGLVRTERFSIAGPSHTLRVPVEEAWTPNVHVQVDLVGAAPRTTDAGVADPRLPPRPAFASGSLSLSIPPAARTLALAVAPRAIALEPGGETTVDVTLKDAGGAPVAGGDVALVVVDEAVLSLTGYRVPDPLKIFYTAREEGVSDHHLRQNVLLGRPDLLTGLPGGVAGGVAGGLLGGLAEPAMADRMPMAAPPPSAAMRRAEATQAGGAAPPPIRMRTDFSALALFAASLPTDAAGRAEVRVKLPDNLTRYRVMAVAASGPARFGSAESTMTARLPLMVRASAPRFLNLGDRVELPVVLQNQTETAMSVDVAMRAANAELTAGRGRRVRVPASDRVEVRFPVAAGRPGTARFQVAAASGRWADASDFSLPVWTPATTEAFAVYGQIDAGAIAQPVSTPPDAFTEFGGLEISTSSTALQALTDAVLYLVSYPFECAEQISSRVLGLAALKDVLTAFAAAGLPDPAALAERVDRDVQRLAGLQNRDGGFALWRRGDESWPYVSVHVAHALVRARAKGFAVPKAALDAAGQYVKDVERHIPADYGPEARHTIVAYALYVRSLMGDGDPARARRLIRDAGLRNLPFEAVGWLLSVLSGDKSSAAETGAIRTLLNNQVSETAAIAHFAVSYGDAAHLLFHSDRRADAVILDALIGDQPRSGLVPKIVEGLLGHRKAGRWENTQENVFVLLALDRYFHAFEGITPDFVARAWLGERYAGEQAFRGRTTERRSVTVPMAMLAEMKGAPTLTIAKEGAGRLYYRIGLQYAPRRLDLQPLDRGFTVERTYEGADDSNDVSLLADGTWHIRAGARVRVRLSLVATSPRYHVALVDPLPAGFEALNPALKTTGSLPAGPPGEVTEVGAPGLGGPGRPGWWWLRTRPWFEHQNLRDERAEAFASLLWEGVYTYTYVARATSPGQFVVPPPRAEEMYHPDTFGRGRTDRVVVETR